MDRFFLNTGMDRVIVLLNNGGKGFQIGEGIGSSKMTIQFLVRTLHQKNQISYSPGHDLSAFSNETQMSIDEQMKYDHVKKWYKTHCPSDYPAVGLLEATPLQDVLQAMDIPIADLSLDFNKLVECPIGTTNVMKPGDELGVVNMITASFLLARLLRPGHGV